MAAGDPRAARASRWCTTGPARTWPAAIATDAAVGGARGAGAIAGELGPVRGRRAVAGRARRAAQPARDPARQPVSRSARPLWRARADRRALGAGAARRARAASPGRAERRRPAGRRSRPRPRRASLYFGVEDDSLALPEHGPRRRRQALPALRRAVRVRRRLPRPPRPLPLRRAAARRGPQPRLIATDVRCEGVRASALHAAHPGGRGGDRARACPGSTTSTTRSRAAALASALEVSLRSIVAGLQASRAAFGRAETVTLEPCTAARRSGRRGAPRARELRILLVKNPAGANEVLRTLALEPGEHDLLGVLNDQIADGRDVSWIWDADFELLAGRDPPRDLRGHARARARAAPEVRGHRAGADRVEADLRPRAALAAADRPQRRRAVARAAAVRAADLHRDARAARAARGARRAGDAWS